MFFMKGEDVIEDALSLPNFKLNSTAVAFYNGLLSSVQSCRKINDRPLKPDFKFYLIQ